LANMLAVGILLNISSQIKRADKEPLRAVAGGQ